MEILENKYIIKNLIKLGFNEYVEDTFILIRKAEPEITEQTIRGRKLYHPLSLKEDYHPFIITLNDKEIEFRSIMQYILYNQLLTNKSSVFDMEIAKAIKFVQTKPNIDNFNKKVFNFMKEGLEEKIKKYEYLQNIIKGLTIPISYISKDSYYGIVKKKAPKGKFNIEEYSTGQNMYGKLLEKTSRNMNPENIDALRTIITSEGEKIYEKIEKEDEINVVENLVEKVEIIGNIYIYSIPVIISWDLISSLVYESHNKTLMIVEREIYGLQYERPMEYDDLNSVDMYKIISRSYSKNTYFCIQYSLNVRLYLEKIGEEKYAFFVHTIDNIDELVIANLIRKII